MKNVERVNLGLLMPPTTTDTKYVACLTATTVILVLVTQLNFFRSIHLISSPAAGDEDDGQLQQFDLSMGGAEEHGGQVYFGVAPPLPSNGVSSFEHVSSLRRRRASYFDAAAPVTIHELEASFAHLSDSRLANADLGNPIERIGQLNLKVM